MVTYSILPDTFIAGAAKSGSTTLFNLLDEHPECLMSQPDHADFFSRSDNLRDPDYYRDYFPGLDGPEPDTPTILGEGTANYMFQPDVPERMARVLGGDARLLFILRHPVDRAVSNYWHYHKKFEDTRSLEDVFALGAEKPREMVEEERENIRNAIRAGAVRPGRLGQKTDDPAVMFQYVSNSRYHVHLDRFLEHFDRDRMCLLLTEQLNDDPTGTLQRVERFLGIDDSFVPDDIERRYNKTIVPRTGPFSTFVHRVLKPLAGTLFSGEKPKPLRKIYHGLTFREKPDTPDWVRRNIEPVLREQTDVLSEEFGLPTRDHW